MADQDDVRRIALSLPETTEGDDRFAFSVRNGIKDKGFAWNWMERVEPKKPRVPRDDVLAVRVANQVEKEMLLRVRSGEVLHGAALQRLPGDHRPLRPAIDVDELAELLTDAWRCQAPRALVTEFERSRSG